MGGFCWNNAFSSLHKHTCVTNAVRRVFLNGLRSVPERKTVERRERKRERENTKPQTGFHANNLKQLHDNLTLMLVI